MKYRSYLAGSRRRLMDIEAETPEIAKSIASEALGIPPENIQVVGLRDLVCRKCGYRWTFGGLRTGYATCSSCFCHNRLDIKE